MPSEADKREEGGWDRERSRAREYVVMCWSVKVKSATWIDHRCGMCNEYWWRIENTIPQGPAGSRPALNHPSSTPSFRLAPCASST